MMRLISVTFLINSEEKLQKNTFNNEVIEDEPKIKEETKMVESIDSSVY